MYERAGSLDTAAVTAAEALCWGRAGHLARKAGWGRERLAELGREMVAGLEEQGRHSLVGSLTIVKLLRT